jgi:hypothetical protein
MNSCGRESVERRGGGVATNRSVSAAEAQWPGQVAVAGRACTADGRGVSELEDDTQKTRPGHLVAHGETYLQVAGLKEAGNDRPEPIERPVLSMRRLAPWCSRDTKPEDFREPVGSASGFRRQIEELHSRPQTRTRADPVVGGPYRDG